MDASEPVTASDLWVESYQGEVLGESLFARLAERERDPEHRHQLEMLTVLERATKELAEPVLANRHLSAQDLDPPGRGHASLDLVERRQRV